MWPLNYRNSDDIIIRIIVSIIVIQTETDMQVKCRKPKHKEIFLALVGLKNNLRTCLKTTALGFGAK